MELTMSRYICVADANNVAHTTLRVASRSQISLLGAPSRPEAQKNGINSSVGAVGTLLRSWK